MVITFCLSGECFIMTLNTNDDLLTLRYQISGHDCPVFLFYIPAPQLCPYSGTGSADITTGIRQGFVIIN